MAKLDNEITVTIDDAAMHLLGMINEMEKKHEAQMAHLNESLADIQSLLDEIKEKIADKDSGSGEEKLHEQ